MKFTIKLLALFFGVLMLANVVSAESPREQLKQMVEQLQKTPNDNALREKIIKLAQELKPAPAVPEEAERRMVRGTAAFKGAKSVADYRDAAKEFEQATLAAPWYGDAYFNLGVAQDKAEAYEAALSSLKLALLALPNSRDIKALIYEVEYRNEKAHSPEVEAAQQRAKDQAFIRNLDGAVFVKRGTFDYGTAEWEIYITNGEAAYTYNVVNYVSDVWRQRLANSGYSGGKFQLGKGRVERRHIPFSGRAESSVITLVNRVANNFAAAGDSMECEISADGFTITCIGTLIDNETWIFQRK